MSFGSPILNELFFFYIYISDGILWNPKYLWKTCDVWMQYSVVYLEVGHGCWLYDEWWFLKLLVCWSCWELCKNIYGQSWVYQTLGFEGLCVHCWCYSCVTGKLSMFLWLLLFSFIKWYERMNMLDVTLW